MAEAVLGNMAGDHGPSVGAVPGEAGRPAGYLRQYQLVDRVRAYQPDVDVDLINRAYVFAVSMHGEQKRASGDPYFAHPVQVAGILTEFKLDAASIAAGLLHDTVEDTDATIDDIRGLFGGDVAEIVDGLTKLNQVSFANDQIKQSGNLQKFVLAISKDPRVLMVKLADRLHNMRTLHYIKNDSKRARIARETLDIYAPLARRIGIQLISNELEDLAFREIDADAYEMIIARMKALRDPNEALLDDILYALKNLLATAGLKGEVKGREKRPYSIWQKLQRKTLTFAQITDIYGFRIIVDDIADCYQVLGLAHGAWACMSNRFKDYISAPKPNGYRSLHTTVIGPKNRALELQIRTQVMDDVADHGLASHWRYKEATYGFDVDAAKRFGGDPLGQVRQLVEILNDGGDSDEFLEHVKREMTQDLVFAFTPKGELKSLPKGATPVDFAYALHTQLGDLCVGARINGVERPLRTALENGDVVEIILGDRPSPPRDGEALAVTGRARSAIRRLVRQKQREEFLTLGRNMLKQVLQAHGVDPQAVVLDEAARRFGAKDVESLLAAIGESRIGVRDVARVIIPDLPYDAEARARRVLLDDESMRLFVDGDNLTPGVSLHLSSCCSPIPGDRIVGVKAPGRGIEVHVTDCAALAELEGPADVWIDLAWTRKAGSEAIAVGRLIVTVENAKGRLGELCTQIGQSGGNILNVKTLRRAVDFFDIVFDIEVVNDKELETIMGALRSRVGVVSVERLRGEEMARERVH